MSKHKLQARIWILIVFVLLTVAHYCFYRFSVEPQNTFAITRGATFGCVLWSTVLLAAMWLRHAWARYLLIALICLAISGFGLTALVLGKTVLEPASFAMRMVVGGTVFYAVALVVLWASRSLIRYLGPRTAGE
jgi:hypothetical protein